MSTEAPETGSSRFLTPSNGSPRSVKSIAGSEGQTKLRSIVEHEMVNEILECPLDQFLNHYAPFSPTQQFIDKVFDDLCNDPRGLLEELKGATDGRALTSFVGVVKSSTLEGPLFENMVDVMDVLQSVDFVEDHRDKRRFTYKDCPSKDMASEIDGTSFRVDACITSNPNANPLVLSDAAVVAEFKVPDKGTDIKDNRLKLVSAANQIMNDDPRRMWVYGITIENGQLSVWYFCRSHSVKSESFHFAWNVKTFIHVFLSFLYARDQEIGYDPTVHRVLHEGKTCYVYEVGTEEAPRFYRTIELLFTARVLCITGRKTRVWKVVEVKGFRGSQFKKVKNEEHMVLKDGWLDENHPPEKDIQTAVFERLGEIQPKDYQWAPRSLRVILDEAFRDEKYTDYFMEILDARRLGKTKQRLLSAKPDPHIFFPAENKTANSASLRHVLSSSTQSGDHSGAPINAPSPGLGRQYPHRREYKAKEQHRLIYRYVGCALNDAEDLLTSFIAIKHAFIALVLLYLAGWMHRDISVGNILVVGKGEMARGKLSDLEYAKEFDDNSFSADPKTGTPYFMPHEIHSGMTLYSPKAKWFSYVDVGEVPDASTPNFSFPEDEGSPESAHPPKFRFHHDLESLWWVTIWIVLYRVGGARALDLVARIFTYTSTPSYARTRFFTKTTDDLKTHIHPDIAFLVFHLNEIRRNIMDFHTSKEIAESSLAHCPQYALIYAQMWGALSWSVDLVRKKENITFHNPPREPQTTEGEKDASRKRPRSNTNTKAGDDDDYRPSRRNNKAISAEPRTKMLREAKEIPRRQL